MQIQDFTGFFKNFGGEFSKVLKGAFEKPMTKMVSEMQKNYKNLFQSFKVARQNLNGEKAGARELVDIFANIKSGNEEELNKSPHEREKAELLKYYEKQQKKQKEYDYIDENVKDSELAKKLKGMIDMKYESQTVAEKNKGDLGELEKMFSSTMLSWKIKKLDCFENQGFSRNDSIYNIKIVLCLLLKNFKKILPERVV